MRLAKPHLDIGLFTNDIAAHQNFWGTQIGLRFDHELPMGPGWVQYRYDANGSVVKVNHRIEPLPQVDTSGFAELTIARSEKMAKGDFSQPSGERVRLVDAGDDGVTGIGITLSSRTPNSLLEFYRDALECEQVDAGTLRCGDSILRFVEGPGGCDLKDFAAPGFRYITVQVFDADQETTRIVSCGSRVVRAVQNFKGVARYGFVADPDGNWIEISARTSLTGIAVS